MDSLVGRLADKLGLGVIGTILLLLVILLFDTNRADRIREIISRFFAWKFAWAEKLAVQAGTQHLVNSAMERLRRELPGAGLRPLRIDWVDNEQAYSLLERGTTIVRLRHHSNRHVNVIAITREYVKATVLGRIMAAVEPKMSLAMELVSTAGFLASGDRDTLTFMITNVLDPLLAEDRDLRNDYDRLAVIDSEGFYTRIFLNEAIKACILRVPKGVGLEREKFSAALRGLAKFLLDIVEKGREEDVPLSFRRDPFSINIILVAKTEHVGDWQRYAAAARKAVAQGHRTIYFAARGETSIHRNAVTLREAVDSLHGTNLLRHNISHKWVSRNRGLHCELVEFSVDGGVQTLFLSSRPRSEEYRRAQLEEYLPSDGYELHGVFKVGDERVVNFVDLARPSAEIWATMSELPMTHALFADHLACVDFCDGQPVPGDGFLPLRGSEGFFVRSERIETVPCLDVIDLRLDSRRVFVMVDSIKAHDDWSQKLARWYEREVSSRVERSEPQPDN